MQGRLTLPARLRLRRKRDFDAAYARGRRLSDGFFSVTAKDNETGVARIGMAVAGRVGGGGGGANPIRPPHPRDPPLPHPPRPPPPPRRGAPPPRPPGPA